MSSLTQSQLLGSLSSVASGEAPFQQKCSSSEVATSRTLTMRNKPARKCIVMCNGPSQGWFDFNTAGEGSKKSGTMTLGDFAVLARLRELGFGDLKGKPREIHFSGCINESYAFHGTGGNFFVKINRSFSAEEMFEGEAQALQRIGASGAIRVPQPLAWGNLHEGGSYIIMEHLKFRPFGMMQASSQECLGRDLARLHLAPTGGHTFGFSHKTRLGIMALENAQEAAPSWPLFFMEHRFADRLQRVYEKLGDSAAEFRTLTEGLLPKCAAILADVAPEPSLLHGDLWVGNSGLLANGQVAIFDPATYIGHSEFDLAFQGWTPAPDFPGFSGAFYGAYHELVPKAPGFEERHHVYQLFQLLNHMLIYGGEYYLHAVKKVQVIQTL